MKNKNEQEKWKSEELREQRKERKARMTTKDGQKKAIRKKTNLLAIVAVLVVIAVLCGLFFLFRINNGYFEKTKVAAKVNGEDITAAELNFYAGTQLFSMMRMQAFTPSGQRILARPMPAFNQQINGEYNDKSVRNIILDQLKEDLPKLKFMQAQAKADGLELNEQQKQGLDNYIAQIKASAAQYQMTPNELLAAIFGKGSDEAQVRRYIGDLFLSQLYEQTKVKDSEVSEEDLKAAYEENKDEFESVSYRMFVLNQASAEPEEEPEETTETADAESTAEDRSTAGTDNTAAESTPEAETQKADESAGSSENSTKPTDKVEIDEENRSITIEKAYDPEAKAKEIKDREDLDKKTSDILEKITDEASFNEAIRDYLSDAEKEVYKDEKATLVSSAYKSTLQPELAQWLFDPARKEGDKTAITSSGKATILYFINRQLDETPTYTTRHILIRVGMEDGKSIQDSDREAAKTKAENILKEYRDGEQTEEAFAALAEKYSDDGGSKLNGGLYENTPRGRFVKSYEEWALDPARKAGDVDLVYEENASYSGYHIIYFKSLGDPIWKQAARLKVGQDQFTKWLDSQADKLSYEAVEDGMRYVLPFDKAAAKEAEESLAAAKESSADEKPEPSATEENQAEASSAAESAETTAGK